MDKLLARQLKKAGDLTVDSPPSSQAWKKFVGMIADQYSETEQSRVLLERSVEISSHELESANKRLQEDGLRQKMVLDRLKQAIDEFVVDDSRGSSPVGDSLQGLLDRLLGLIHDHAIIESQLRYQSVLMNDQKERLRTILNSIADGVVVMDRDKKITLINPTTEVLTGFSESELLHTTYNEHLVFISKKNNLEQKDFINEVFQEKRVAVMPSDTVCITKSGSEIPVADSAAPIFNEAGELDGCVLVFRDITREKEVDQMKSEFVSVASHQLRTPLTGIKWLAEFLLRGKAGALTDPQQDLVKKLSETNQRMIELVNDLLNVSRIEGGRNMDLQPERADLIALWKSILAEHVSLAEHQRIHIDFLPNNLETCVTLFDPRKMREVFNNLLSNAIKYTPSDGLVQVEIALHQEKNEVVCSVKDSGIGIPEDQQTHLFEKFFRARNVILTKQEGTGLGLYIVKALVEKHQGRLEFVSKEGQGTTFRVILPLK